jgi:hypothetical protein
LLCVTLRFNFFFYFLFFNYFFWFWVSYLSICWTKKIKKLVVEDSELCELHNQSVKLFHLNRVWMFYHVCFTLKKKSFIFLIFFFYYFDSVCLGFGSAWLICVAIWCWNYCSCLMPLWIPFG